VQASIVSYLLRSLDHVSRCRYANGFVFDLRQTEDCECIEWKVIEWKVIEWKVIEWKVIEVQGIGGKGRSP